MSLLCQSHQDVSMTLLRQALPSTRLYGDENTSDAFDFGWLLSPTPYVLTEAQLDLIPKIGHCLYQFSVAIDALYRNSLKATPGDPVLGWVKDLYHAGKPSNLLALSQMNRFKRNLPLVIRPDLLVTEKGFTLCEIDAVPGGIGFLGALSQAYKAVGYRLLGDEDGIPKAFLNMLLEAYPDKTVENPHIAIVVSDEAEDYRKEMAWLTEAIKQSYPNIWIVHPKEITLVHNQLGFSGPEAPFTPVHMIYRFFELFDLPNIPQIELIQYAVKKGLVFCTPPFKPHLEEKLSLALIHHPFLEAYWLQALGPDNTDLMKRLVPESWIMDPAVIPPHAAVVPPLNFHGRYLKDFQDLGELTQKQRELVIKPSGFSPLAWGSRGVKVGHDLPQELWRTAIQDAFNQFPDTPHLLQRFENTTVEPYLYFQPDSGKVVEHQGRTRLCPYYFITGSEPVLAGILATTCPKERKIIHGMSDGVMRPVCFHSREA